MECASKRKHAAAQGCAMLPRSGACAATQDRDALPCWGGEVRTGEEERHKGNENRAEWMCMRSTALHVAARTSHASSMAHPATPTCVRCEATQFLGVENQRGAGETHHAVPHRHLSCFKSARSLRQKV
jgi:hypothetical protein